MLWFPQLYRMHPSVARELGNLRSPGQCGLFCLNAGGSPWAGHQTFSQAFCEKSPWGLFTVLAPSNLHQSFPGFMIPLQYSNVEHICAFRYALLVSYGTLRNDADAVISIRLTPLIE